MQGLKRIAATGPVAMGAEGLGGTFHFVYAIGGDATIHVADVTPTHTPVECETQIDRRYLHTETDVGLLSCFPVGGPDTPPRRAGATGPGIHLPQREVPLDITFMKGSTPKSMEPEPTTLNGLFAIVSTIGPTVQATHGLVFVINVNDDNYEDIEDRNDPGVIDIGLAIPHALRDDVTDRRLPPPYADSTVGRIRIDGDPQVTNAPQGAVFANTAGPENAACVTNADCAALSQGICDAESLKCKSIFLPMVHRAPYTDASGVHTDWELAGDGAVETRRSSLDLGDDPEPGAVDRDLGRARCRSTSSCRTGRAARSR